MSIDAEGIKVLETSLSGVEKHYIWKCVKCRSRVSVCNHHITYKPEITVLICQSCHCQVTLANATASVVLKRKLTSEDRIKIWEWFRNYKGIVTEDKVAIFLGVDYIFSIKDIWFICSAGRRVSKYGRSRGNCKHK